jgi:hypothetical protein
VAVMGRSDKWYRYIMKSCNCISSNIITLIKVMARWGVYSKVIAELAQLRYHRDISVTVDGT